MKIKLLVFGILTDIFGNTSLELEAPSPINVGGLRKIIIEKHPKVAELHIAVAVDEIYANDETTINENQIIALIPPVSGG